VRNAPRPAKALNNMAGSCESRRVVGTTPGAGKPLLERPWRPQGRWLEGTDHRTRPKAENPMGVRFGCYSAGGVTAAAKPIIEQALGDPQGGFSSANRPDHDSPKRPEQNLSTLLERCRRFLGGGWDYAAAKGPSSRRRSIDKGKRGEKKHPGDGQGLGNNL